MAMFSKEVEAELGVVETTLPRGMSTLVEMRCKADAM
jgi:hypothetical protein